jgi:hypothetical protein
MPLEGFDVDVKILSNLVPLYKESYDKSTYGAWLTSSAVPNIREVSSYCDYKFTIILYKF